MNAALIEIFLSLQKRDSHMQTIILSRDMLSLLEKHSRSGDFEENYCVDTGCEIDVGSDSYAEGKSHILWDCRERFTRLLSPPWWPSWGRQEATGRSQRRVNAFRVPGP